MLHKRKWIDHRTCSHRFDGSAKTESLGGKYYILAIDDHSRFSWVFFLYEKLEIFNVFESLYLKLQTENFT